MTNVPEIFGRSVYNEHVMRETLPKDIFKKLKKTIDSGAALDNSIATVVANSMKDWAISKGATHYTHWFQPMTGVTAEKHESFITPTDGSTVIMEFSGKELIKGESDASSFPSGGLRATFEARGYTAWDPSSYAFVKDGTLYIPTVFCSYSGEALDKKTPLLRSMEAIDVQAKRILHLFGKNPPRVVSSVGAEQEYFIIDKKYYDKRDDLMFTGRTLFGAKPPKGQELDDHYYGSIKTKISEYMKDLDEELWTLGILSKTKHNEGAPAQHELAPIFGTTNVATDHNQLIMETMKKVAEKHGLVCLLHEKPFAGVNGSGKHNNWSLSAEGCGNLMDPGASPSENAQFLLFLSAVIKAVDEHQDLLRISVASAGNDHRLGGNEAPPAIVSMFVGDELEEILEAIISGEEYSQHKKEKLEIGVDMLPRFSKDTTDRNRTSPFAFTGNKFEFRMPGSSQSIAGINTIINTIVADSLCEFADELENAEDFNSALSKLIKRTVKKHFRIIFNGNNYSDEWVAEAEKRGLLNLHSSADCLPMFASEKNVKLFAKHKVYTEAELISRQEVKLDSYIKVLNIEALTMLEMAKRDILPAVILYSKEVAKTAKLKKELGVDSEVEMDILSKLSALGKSLYEKIDVLDAAIIKSKEIDDTTKKATFFSKDVFEAMQLLRAVADELETIVSEKYWPMPTYSELLFKL
ncbi:MAG: glutamine synthetase III [Clostridia bacterium]|nr:glutamine synthetase III [Clostridia bacterium]